MQVTGFNPLKIGSTCNIKAKKSVIGELEVSIPLKSGLHVIDKKS